MFHLLLISVQLKFDNDLELHTFLTLQQQLQPSKGLDKALMAQLYAFLSNVKEHVRLEVFTVVTMKNGIFWDVTPCGSCKNRRFGGT
jgi:hypothetical protein